jgi:neutral ceramidase
MEVHCQAPKPILLNTGNIKEPYKWDPESVPISIFQVGSFLLLNVPSEFTTMAGRRLRRSVKDVAASHGLENVTIVIAGLSNSYTHYVTTFEEYQGQRYEAASTLYGPHTLEGYIQEFERIANDLFTGQPSSTGKSPDDLSGKQISLLPPVIADICPWRTKFGGVIRDALSKMYVAGVDTVEVEFHSANPRNNQRTEGTFLTVDKLNVDGSWTTKYVDGDWCTRFMWESSTTFLGISYARITWDIPPEAEEGSYRICHYGTAKRIRSLASWLSEYMPEFSNKILISVYLVSLKLFTFMDSRVHTILQLWDTSLNAYFQDFEGCTQPFSVTHN